jgi:hypothetical protein
MRYCSGSESKLHHGFTISEVSKDKEFQSVMDEEERQYLGRIKELENMVCELITILEISTEG